MNRVPESTDLEVVAARMKLLPRQHRIAHLQVLIGRQPPGSYRWRALAALLRDEMTTPPSKADRVA